MGILCQGVPPEKAQPGSGGPAELQDEPGGCWREEHTLLLFGDQNVECPSFSTPPQHLEASSWPWGGFFLCFFTEQLGLVPPSHLLLLWCHQTSAGDPESCPRWVIWELFGVFFQLGAAGRRHTAALFIKVQMKD